ncbi:M23 family metallopeptidase [Magnetospira sp. QH-2]|uniref:M23 family metallopeptidase n=1 Tax=Magnetospira sp. (strain QH-2) TaxID=1288970 RepID=UPI0003E81671|nr:M23 family metallopeptidase [Magnetospira sp. QH-2]CCQ75673.1 putative Peptidase M23B [Magnetospira sp. QH-2]
MPEDTWDGMAPPKPGEIRAIRAKSVAERTHADQRRLHWAEDYWTNEDIQTETTAFYKLNSEVGAPTGHATGHAPFGADSARTEDAKINRQRADHAIKSLGPDADPDHVRLVEAHYGVGEPAQAISMDEQGNWYDAQGNIFDQDRRYEKTIDSTQDAQHHQEWGSVSEWDNRNDSKHSQPVLREFEIAKNPGHWDGKPNGRVENFQGLENRRPDMVVSHQGHFFESRAYGSQRLQALDSHNSLQQAPHTQDQGGFQLANATGSQAGIKGNFMQPTASQVAQAGNQQSPSQASNRKPPQLASPVPGGAIRSPDAMGDGRYGASRDGGKRNHQGVDIVANPGQDVTSTVDGTVTKLGYPYANDKSYRYVEIQTKDGYVVRHFYVNPGNLKPGQAVVAGKTKIGTVQDLSKRYPKGMTNHIHVEIRDRNKVAYPNKSGSRKFQDLDPTSLLQAPGPQGGGTP